MNNLQQTTLWLGAFRYYLGRRTYAVSDFCNCLINEWQALPSNFQKLVKCQLDWEFRNDDLARQSGDPPYPLGDDCDRAQWERVRELWKESCRKCTGTMKPSKAIEQTWIGSPEFSDGEICTMLPGGSGKLIDCMKCESCGWSVK